MHNKKTDQLSPYQWFFDISFYPKCGYRKLIYSPTLDNFKGEVMLTKKSGNVPYLL